MEGCCARRTCLLGLRGVLPHRCVRPVNEVLLRGHVVRRLGQAAFCGPMMCDTCANGAVASAVVHYGVLLRLRRDRTGKDALASPVWVLLEEKHAICGLLDVLGGSFLSSLLHLELVLLESEF